MQQLWKMQTQTVDVSSLEKLYNQHYAGVLLNEKWMASPPTQLHRLKIFINNAYYMLQNQSNKKDLQQGY